MLETGNVRYELVDNGSSESLLHCYIPKNFTARLVPLLEAARTNGWRVQGPKVLVTMVSVSTAQGRGLEL